MPAVASPDAFQSEHERHYMRQRASPDEDSQSTGQDDVTLAKRLIATSA